MKKTERTKVVLVFSSKEDRTSYDNEPLLRLTVRPCRVEEGRRVKNFGSPSSANGLWLDGLVVESLAFSHKGERRAPHHDEAEYDSVRVRTVEQARAMARTLGTVAKRLADARERLGPTETYGAYVARVALALGASHVLFAQRSGGIFHDDADYAWETPGDAVGRIDAVVSRWLAPERPTVVIYTTAPEEYDGFGTAGEEISEERGGKPIRRVVVRREHLLWQTSRYGSGSHYVATEEEHRA